MSNGFIASGAQQVSYVRLASVKGMLKLERAGMKTRGGPIRPRLAVELGLKPRATFDVYIATVEAKMAEILKTMEPIEQI